jgi:hypothetical protein
MESKIKKVGEDSSQFDPESLSEQTPAEFQNSGNASRASGNDTRMSQFP